MTRLILALATFTGVVLCIEPRVALHSRQGINVPTACQSACAPITAALSSQNCPKEQCCTETFANGLRDCFLCIGTLTATQDYSAPQQTLDEFVSSCAAQGAPIPRVTLPGQNDTRPSSSFNPSTLQTSTQSTTQSTTTSSTPAQSSPASNSGTERCDIKMKGLGVIVLGALGRVARVF